MVSGIQDTKMMKIEDFSTDVKTKKEKTSYQLNHNLLIISLIVMIVIGTTYFWLDERSEFLESFWVLILAIW
jgi:hypothetical protein